jgi:hypothetical protein
MDSKSRVMQRMNGRSSKYPLSAQTVPLEVALRNKLDPAQAWPGAPPNFGLEDMPHIFSFVGRYGMVANAYMHADEALLHSSQNAEIMRNEPMIMECIEARMRCVSLLNWHIQPVDNDYLRDALDRADSQETAQSIRNALSKPKSDAEFIADKLTSILRHTPQFMKFRYALMDAIWYGKYATVQTMGTRVIGGKRRVFVRKWEPRHGDKLVFRYSDGDFEHDPDQVGIRIGPAVSRFDDGWVDYAGFERNRVDPTQHGLVYWFDGQQRKRMCVHKHIIEDADFMRPEKAGSINGVGIRSRIYWTWWAYQESLKLLMEYIERSALGIEIWKYPAHDPKAKERTEAAAKERGSPGRSCVLVPVPTGEYGDMYGVEIVEPGLGGIGELQNVLQTFFGHKIKRYILGQTLTSEADATGLGSGVADAHLATFHDIVRFDGLNLEETLTTDLVRPLQLWNFPGSDDIYLRFVIDTESPDAQERIAGYQAAWAMGLKIRTEDMYDALGAAPPSEGEEFLDNPGLDSARLGNKAQQLQMEQMQMQMQMQQAQPQQVMMAPFPQGQEGVPGDGDMDGLASDDQNQLFTDERSPFFQSQADVERYAADDAGTGSDDRGNGDVEYRVFDQGNIRPALGNPTKSRYAYGEGDFADVPTTSGITVNGSQPSPAPMQPLPKAIQTKKEKKPSRAEKESNWEKPHSQAINPHFKNWSEAQVQAVARPIAGDDAIDRHTVGIFKGEEPFSVVHPEDPSQPPRAIHVARALDDRSLKRGGKLDVKNESHRAMLAQDMASEVAHYAQDKGVTGWYDKSIEKMMHWLNRLYPGRFENNPHEAALFKLAVAVHSSATEVSNNLMEAIKQFDFYAKNGHFDPTPNGKGKTLKNQANARQQINAMMDRFQWHTSGGKEDMIQFLESEMENRELLARTKSLDMPKKVSGLRMGTKVYGAQFFGPKIGAFYNNLHGNYNPVTVDMWFMRSLGRLRGSLTQHSVNAIRGQAVRVHNELLNIRQGDARLHGHDKKELLRQCKQIFKTGRLEGSESLMDWADKRHKLFATSTAPGRASYADVNELNRAAKGLDESFYKQNLAPSGAEWDAIPEIVRQAQDLLQKQGIHISNAEFQAALWYYEKGLWERLGYDSSSEDEEGEELKSRKSKKKKADEPRKKKRATEQVDFGSAAEEIYHRLKAEGRQVL